MPSDRHEKKRAAQVDDWLEGLRLKMDELTTVAQETMDRARKTVEESRAERLRSEKARAERVRSRARPTGKKR